MTAKPPPAGTQTTRTTARYNELVALHDQKLIGTEQFVLDMRTHADTLERELAAANTELWRIDFALERREALDNLPTRMEKILRTINVAAANDPKAELASALQRASTAEQKADAMERERNRACSQHESAASKLWDAEAALATAEKELVQCKKESAINAENFHVTNQALVDYDRKRIAAETALAAAVARTREFAEALYGSFVIEELGDYFCVHCDADAPVPDWEDTQHRPDCIINNAKAIRALPPHAVPQDSRFEGLVSAGLPRDTKVVAGTTPAQSGEKGRGG